MKNPATAKEDLKKRILSYADMALPIKNGMSEETWKKFQAFQQSDSDVDGLNIIKPPYLEVAKEYVRANYSLAQLASSEGGNLLHEKVAEAFAKYLLDDDKANAQDVYPYQHQYEALKAVREGKNLVVCTGTGSGKTESFLLPLIDKIYRAHLVAGDKYDRHIRALILYPMNALVNDQIARLRRLLRYLPEITFGQFIGTTAHNGVDVVEVEESLIKEVNDLERMPLESGKLDLRPIECLSNEYRTRDQWNKAPADILVTNYSMLERLLLLPESKCGFFTKCWDFIVIDEAHSYTGSVGTEIAWLMRRLERRLRPNSDEGTKKIQFLATSATLSEGDDWSDKAKEFAAAIFPVDKDSVHAEAGEFAKPSSAAEQPLQDSLQNFFDKNKQTYDKTIEYESEVASLKALSGDIALKKAICENGGKVSCEQLYALQNQFSLDDERPVLKRTNALTALAAVTLKKVNIMRNGKPGNAGERDNWRDFLHDVTKKTPSPIKGDTVSVKGGGEVQNRRGNRLDVLEVWRQMVNWAGGDPKEISYAVFYFMYVALLEMLQDVPKLPSDLNRITLEITDSIKTAFNTDIDDYNKRKEASDKTLAELDSAWGAALGCAIQDKHYAEMIYDNIVNHRQIVQFRKLSEGQPKSLDDYASELKVSTQDFIKIVSIGALARSPHRRNAVIEVRYHQVVRDISDVGVYFKDGQIDKPQFIRSNTELAKNGEKVFSLGVCRDCGQPYLLGYSDKQSFVSPIHLMRASTPSYKFMYAVAIGTPKPVDGDVEEMAAPNEGLWLNLRTGELSDNEGDASKVTSVYWLEKSDEGCSSNSFISKCPRCGTVQKHMSTYGILTPYEAVGEQYRIAVLDAFANLVEEDTNPQIRETATAAGRKVLAFSDSRAQAAQLACEFETVKERRLADKVTLDLVSQAKDGVKKLLPKAQQARDEIIKNLMRSGADSNALSSNLSQLLDDPKNYYKSRSIDTLIHNEDPTRNQFKDELEKCRYEQMLEWEGEDGKKVDEATTAKFLILKAIRDTARNGLCAQNLIDIRSAEIEREDEWNALECNELRIDAEKAKKICQSIYKYLALRRKIELPEAFSRDGEKGNYLDAYERKVIKRAGFCEIRRNFAVYSTCLLPIVLTALGKEQLSNEEKEDAKNWLNEVFTWFTEKWRILVRSSLVDDEYTLTFDQVCSDLEILRLNPGCNLPEVIPFSIEEHTAQIEGHIGALYQKAFAEGKINILSCSTTFEMGIDVGGLNNVFLGNLPPASSNYRQRAGRAGRRPGSAAYILSVAGQSLHDRNYFSDVPSLFWGKIEPPRIYLEKPVFAARHFRAEALHSFLEYVDKHKEQSRKKDKNWEKASYFILGWHAHRQGIKFSPASNEDYCSSLGEKWMNECGATIKDYVSSINDYPGFKAGLGDMAEQYSPAEDLLFQLLGSIKVNEDEKAFRFYQNMGGCRLPELRDGKTVESLNLKRMALKERLYRQLYTHRTSCDNNRYENSWPARGDKQNGCSLEIAQVRLLQKRTIEILSESCVLPRYGFPVDEIELILDPKEEYADVEFRRSLQLGLFEYAPGQTVVANKRRYESVGAAFLRYPTDGEPEESLATRLAEKASFCKRCHKIFDDMNDCQLCGQPLERNCKFITPDVFYAKRSVDGKIRKVRNPKGRRIVRWGGDLISKYHVGDTSIWTAESSDRMMQYINTNAGDKGFTVNKQDGYYYVHEIQTNIAIWYTSCKLPFVDEAPVEHVSRFDNACLSAAYALRRSCAHKLNVSVQDLGVLYMPIIDTSKRKQAQFVFFDTAAGGGGNALSLTMSDKEDGKTAAFVREIVEGAIKALKEDNHEHDDNALCEQPSPTNTRLMPLPANIYWAMKEGNEREEADKKYRPAVACYKCLKDFDNQDVQSSLDKYDAIAILEALLKNPDSSSEDESKWVPFDPEHDKLVSMKRYKKMDGTEFLYNPLEFQGNKADVAFKKVCHD